MRVRRAAAEDFEAIAELWRQFDHEVPPPTHEGPADEEKELGEVREIIASEIAFVAEDDQGAPIGFALARRRASGFGTLTDLYVARRDTIMAAYDAGVALYAGSDGGGISRHGNLAGRKR